MKEEIKWGILGAGNIAHRFIESLKHIDNCKVVAISGRNYEKLKAFAQEYSVESIYTDHSQLLKDNRIDCVYIATPHHLHKKWILEALNNKKAVLCEKPAVLDSKDLKEIEDSARQNNTLFMEAMKSRFLPAYIKTKELIETGIIGKIESITTSFCSVLEKESYGKTYHTDKASRGVLYDTGVYGSALLEDFFGPLESISSVKSIMNNEIIMDVRAELNFKEGNGNIECSFISDEPRRAVFKGTDGEIILENYYRAETIKVITREGETVLDFPYLYDDFYSQILHFVKLYEEKKIESDLMSLEDSIESIKILEEIYSYIS